MGPIISPQTHDYTNIKIGDVAGWAPTPDTFKYNVNSCTGKPFVGETLLSPAEDGNEAAITALLDGTFDALYLYADQLNNFATTGSDAAVPHDVRVVLGALNLHSERVFHRLGPD